MIATVRIAPIKQWCDPMKKIADSLPLPPKIGAQVSIDTASMQIDGPNVLCKGRSWRAVWWPDECAAVDLDTQELCPSEVRDDGGENWVCEHVLELD